MLHLLGPEDILYEEKDLCDADGSGDPLYLAGHDRAVIKALGILGVLAFSLAKVASAQTVSPSGFAVISGVAVDSVRGGYLKDASVTLSNSRRSASTDSLGRFTIDSIAPGSYSVRLLHPLLDTLGVSVSTRPTAVRGGDTITFVLSVPSPSTVVTRKCSVKERELGNAALAGVVLDADTEMPSIGAEVVVAWTDIAVGSKTIAKTPQRRSSKIGIDGSYFICGIPDDLATGVLATRGADSTSEVPLSFARRLVLQSFHLPTARNAIGAAGDTLHSPRGTSVASGKILTDKRRPIAGARIAVEADDAVTTSDADGNFRLTGVRAGTRELSVRKLGYTAMEISMDFSSVTAQSTTVTLLPIAQSLKTVTVSSLRDIGLQRVGFTERRRLGSGTYLGPKEIDGKNAPKLGILLATVPALSGRSCVRYWIDGHIWSSMSDSDASLGPDAFLSGAELGAVEVYSPLTAPAEFVVNSKMGMCASVVVWTKNKIGR